jgi:DivIVA domain-containing protein
MVKSEQITPFLESGEQLQVWIPVGRRVGHGYLSLLLVATDRSFLVFEVRGFLGQQPKKIRKRYRRNIVLNTGPSATDLLQLRTRMSVRLGEGVQDVYWISWLFGHTRKCRLANEALAELVREHKVGPPIKPESELKTLLTQRLTGRQQPTAPRPEPSRVTPGDVRHVRFSLSRVAGDGYDKADVDAFLYDVEAQLRDMTGNRITVSDVENVAFRKPPQAQHGYNPRDVDDFLDAVVAEMRRRTAEDAG